MSSNEKIASEPEINGRYITTHLRDMELFIRKLKENINSKTSADDCKRWATDLVCYSNSLRDSINEHVNNIICKDV